MYFILGKNMENFQVSPAISCHALVSSDKVAELFIILKNLNPQPSKY